MNKPTMMRTGAIAADGMARKNGERNRERAKHTAVVNEVARYSDKNEKTNEYAEHCNACFCHWAPEWYDLRSKEHKDKTDSY